MRARSQNTARVLPELGVSAPPGSLVCRRSQADRCCSICGEPTLDNLVDAGGDVGVVHRPCFVRWDTEQEALEQMYARSAGFPHHSEEDVELEPDPHDQQATYSRSSRLARANGVPQLDTIRSAA